MGFFTEFYDILIGVLNGQWEFGHLETSVIGSLMKTVVTIVDWTIFELWQADVQCKTWLSDAFGPFRLHEGQRLSNRKWRKEGKKCLRWNPPCNHVDKQHEYGVSFDTNCDIQALHQSKEDKDMYIPSGKHTKSY